MSKLDQAAEFAFEGHNDQCMRVFAPFFTNLFNPANHKYEEKREASQFSLGSVTKSVSKHAKHATDSVKKISKKSKGLTNKTISDAIHLSKKGVNFTEKIGKKATKEALKDAKNAPAFYSKINEQTGGALDMAVIMGATAAGTAAGGPVGGMAGGMLGEMAVGALHS